jgi:O-antigen/teichoic acid export membrane protein
MAEPPSDQSPKPKRPGKGSGARKQAPPPKHEHTHPGGAGALLGAQLARFSGLQGLSLLLTNILHYGSIAVVARLLGPGKLGAYALLFFLTGLITQIIHMLSKPGTMMRTFGVSDDDDDDVEGDDESKEQASVLPTYTLGVGVVWTTILAAVAISTVFIFRTQIAQFLLHDPGQADAVVFATITGSVWALFKLAEMVLWFEGRGLTYALIEAARPTFNLIAIIVIVSAGAGVKGAIIGQTIGTTLATVICVALIWKSFQVGFSFGELKEILNRGWIRAPIASSMWVVQNADSFILSRFVDHKDIGLYNLASRTGFMVAFLPQGFRIALRPVRKTASYEAFMREYGVAVANGQMLAYFWLLTLTAVLAMVLGGEILIQIGGPRFASAAPIIPLTAGAMSMPALYRSVSQYAVYPNKRRNFVIATILVAACYIAFMLLLLSGTNLGIYSAPISMLTAFLIPIVIMFTYSQRGPKPLDFPYLSMSLATLVATVIAVGFHFLHPAGELPKLPVIAALMLVWFASLFVLRIIPRYHWDPLRHITVSALRRGSALKFNPKAGLRSLKPGDRKALRTAVLDRLPPAVLAPSTAALPPPTLADGEDPESDPELGQLGDTEGARLVRLLRDTGRSGGVRIDERNELDADISLYLFSDEPVAVRLRKMRQLLTAGADPHELRVLEGLRDDLAKIPADGWRTTRSKGNGRGRAHDGDGSGPSRGGGGRDGDGRGAPLRNA